MSVVNADTVLSYELERRTLLLELNPEVRLSMAILECNFYITSICDLGVFRTRLIAKCERDV